MYLENREAFRRPCTRAQASRLAALAALILTTTPTLAGGLKLEDAERLALANDPSLQVLQSRRSALEEMAVANAQLPDPMLRTGIMSLPTDTWELGQEPMTQVQVGISQKFPRGRTRELRSEQTLEQSAAVGENLDEQRLRIVLSVREEYLEALKQARLAEINADAEVAFADLAEITQDYYATGRVQQQDVLSAAVELARVQDRAKRIAQEEDRARARLETWIGEAAWQAFDGGWPEFETVPGIETINQGLAGHPRVAALQQRVQAAETGIELADQRYKPEFGVDLSYGGRGGNDMDGSSRPDLFSVMVVMDLPLFPGNRQDRYKAAAVSEASATAFERDDVYRRMRSELRMQAATLARQRERLALFEDTLLPDASFNADAAFAAYQAALEDLTTLMRARITEYELQLEYATLRAETLKTLARLRYFMGEAS